MSDRVESIFLLICISILLVSGVISYTTYVHNKEHNKTTRNCSVIEIYCIGAKR